MGGRSSFPQGKVFCAEMTRGLPEGRRIFRGPSESMGAARGCEKGKPPGKEKKNLMGETCDGESNLVEPYISISGLKKPHEISLNPKRKYIKSRTQLIARGGAKKSGCQMATTMRGKPASKGRVGCHTAHSDDEDL